MVVRLVHELTVTEEHDVSKVHHEGGEGKDEEVSPQRSTHDGDENEDDEESQLTDVSGGGEHLFNFNIISNKLINHLMVEGREFKLLLKIINVHKQVPQELDCRIIWSRGQRTAKTKGFKLKPDQPDIKLTD